MGGLPDLGTLALSLDQHVLTVTLDRDEQRNTVTYAVLDDLLAAFDHAEHDDDVRAVVVTGAGGQFSYGTDLRPDGGGYATGSADFQPLRGGDRDVGGELAIRIYNSTRPVLAAVNGTAVGIGVSMILPMDVRVCADTSRFTLPFVRRGILPESCSTWFLPRVVGITTATYWSMTGKMVTADEALARGLVNEVVPAGEVLARTQEIAVDIATRSSPVSVALTRQMLWRGLGEPHPMAANVLESQALLSLGRLPDAKEGVASFLEKRPPAFPTPLSAVPAPLPWWDEPTFRPRSS